MVSIEGVDLNLFLVLHHVLREGSVKLAAECMHVTPSAVSNSLARLRHLVGDPLLVRSGRNLTATPRARELAPKIANAIETLRGVLEVKEPFRPETCSRSFTIATSDHIGVLPSIVERFRRQLPRATLRIVTLDYAVASDTLAAGDVDVLLGLPPTMAREWHSEPAYSDRLVCALSPDNPAAGRKLTLDQFLGCQHVEVALQGKHPIDYVDLILARLGCRRSVSLSVPQFTLAAICVVGTPYVTMLPESMARRLAAFLPLTLREPPFEVPPITILQVWHERTAADPGSTLLRAIIRDAFPMPRSRGRARRGIQMRVEAPAAKQRSRRS